MLTWSWYKEDLSELFSCALELFSEEILQHSILICKYQQFCAFIVYLLEIIQNFQYYKDIPWSAKVCREAYESSHCQRNKQNYFVLFVEDSVDVFVLLLVLHPPSCFLTPIPFTLMCYIASSPCCMKALDVFFVFFQNCVIQPDIAI